MLVEFAKQMVPNNIFINEYIQINIIVMTVYKIITEFYTVYHESHITRLSTNCYILLLGSPLSVLRCPGLLADSMPF